MKRTTICTTLAPRIALSLILVAPQAPSLAAEPGRGAVAADHAAASACGAWILDRGGNAADAAVAAALCAGVVQPAGSGLGGGGFAVWVDPSAPESEVIDFREVAPAAASRDMYLGAHGAPVPGASSTGPRSVAVPSESRGLATLLTAHGSLSFRVVAAPAIRLAARGFTVGDHLAASLARATAPEVLDELSVDGHAAVAGDVLRRPDLATTLRRWVRTRGEDLATGRSARAIAEHVAEAGGELRAEDLADYTVVRREPVRVSFHGFTVVTMPPPSSGGIALAQMLRVLEGYDLASLGRDSPAYLHLLAEVMKHAYADRARRLGDPAFVEVPQAALLSDERVAAIRLAIDPSRTFPPAAYGMAAAPADDHGTQHISTLDRQGNAVALTTTINNAFGANMVAPGTGVILNDEMDDFAAAPGVPNSFGLVTGEENAVAPGKRPLSSMSPTVVLGPDGHVVLVVGASGGGQIIASTLQVLLDVLVFGLSPEEAVAAPRIHHQWMPDQLWAEEGIPLEVREALASIGHEIVVRPLYSCVQAIAVGEGGGVDAGSDPRKGGAPAFSDR